MTAVVLLPVGLGGFTLAALFYPLVRRSGYRQCERDVAEQADIARILAGVANEPRPEPMPDLDDVGYRPRHRLADALGSSAQRVSVAALRQTTEEFKAIVATSYRSGELPLIGRPPTGAMVRAHLAAVMSS